MPKLLVIALLFFSCSSVPKPNIDLLAIENSENDWEVICKTDQPLNGHYKLFHDKWLMYFLHWRPLTEENREISVAYAKKLLLSFWGPDMPFTIRGEGGKTNVGEHPAFYIDGDIYEGSIRTRFIIWNCPETKRQFISDCNINVASGTPSDLLELQYHITSTIRCHEGMETKSHPVLKKLYQSKKYDLSFRIPENWRTNKFNLSNWFPKGLTKTNGTLWTLITDSGKFIDLIWEKKKGEISEDLFLQFVKRLEDKSFSVEDMSFTLGDFKFTGVKSENGGLMGRGAFNGYCSVEDQKITQAYQCRGYLWTAGERTYFLLASMLNKESVWGMPVDLSPDENQFNHFINDEVKKIVPKLNSVF